MEGSRNQETKSTELQRDGNTEKSNHDEVSQSVMTSAVTQPTETASDPCGDLSSKDKETGSTFKEEENEKPLEGNTATKGKKKKKRKKKKTGEPASTDSTTPLVPTEEADLNGDPSLPNASKLTCVEECEKNEEPLERIFTGKKRKRKKKKKTKAVTNSELPNADDDHISERDIESNSEGLVNVADLSVGSVLTVHDQCKTSTQEEVTPQTDITVQDHEDLESMRKETLDFDENNLSKNEGSDAVALDSGDGSCKSFESRPEESIELVKEAEDVHALKEDRSCSPENMGPESTAHGVDSHKESSPFEGAELAREGGDFPAPEEEDRIGPPEKCPENESPETTTSDGVKGTEAAGGHADLVEELEASDEDNSYVKLDHEGYVPFNKYINL